MHCYCIRNPTRIRTLFYTYIILHSWTGRRLNLIPGFNALPCSPAGYLLELADRRQDLPERRRRLAESRQPLEDGLHLSRTRLLRTPFLLNQLNPQKV